MTMTSRALTLRGTSYPLVLPSIRDPRLHIAAVILSIHALGQIGLHFQVSVPQILAAILACAAIEVVLTFWQTRSIVWPASAMLTGSGVALIFRVVGTSADDPWATNAWYLFAIVAGLSLLTKYVIRFRGTHVFNPSNVGLVVAFLLIGSSRVEPLDFWWAPLNVWMVAAYVIIIGGGVLITRRLHLLAMAVAFWITFAVGIAILAASGHCMTTRWAFAPVCGLDFWRVLVSSPEVLIFLLFMITDPRTTPAGRVGRVVFGLLVGVLATLLIAPQTDEFGAKVGLLASLVILCAGRWIVDRFVPEPRSAADDLGRFVRRLASGAGPGARPIRVAARVGLAGLAAVVAGVGIVAAGTPARGLVLPDPTEVLSRVPHQIDTGTLPTVSVGQDVQDWDHLVAGPEMPGIVLTLAENLELESQALLHHDPTILAAVDHGDRLIEMKRRLADAEAAGTTVIDRYRFDSLSVSLLVPFGMQTALSLGFAGRGTMTEQTYDADGHLQGERTAPFTLTFAMSRPTGARWLNVAVLPATGG